LHTGSAVPIGGVVAEKAVFSPSDTPPSTADPCGLSVVYCQEELGKQITTAYTAIETCKGKCINASGKAPIKGQSIACPRAYPLGTKVKIDGQKYICDDRTAKWADGRWDIFYGYSESDYQEAIKYGKQLKEVIIQL